MEKVFKILSIDGGGIKGLYSSIILEAFEERYGPISDYFDMLVGTSTGGLIALALSLKISLEDISNLYEEKGNLIFKKSFFSRCKQIVCGGKYKSNNLKEELQNLFKNKKIYESNNLLCIPSYSITEARPYIFKYDHKEGNYNRDNKELYVDVALATSAAPTYFPVHNINGHQLIDGGIYVNNPTLVAITEALKYFVGKDKEFTSLEVLSISSLEINNKEEAKVKNNRSFLNWGDKLFDTSMNAQNYMTDFMMKTLSELNNLPIKYKRIKSGKVSGKYVALDKSDKATIDIIKQKGRDKASFITKDEEVISFFKNKKQYIIKGDK